MSVEFILPQHGADGDCQAFDAEGKSIKLPHRIVVNPYFFRPDSVANVLFCRVLAATGTKLKADAPEIQKLVFQQPGTTGKLKIVDRSQRVLPKFIAVNKRVAERSTVADADDELAGATR